MNKQLTIKELKEQGNQVKVYHARLYKRTNNLSENYNENFLCMSRKDFDKLNENIKNNFELNNHGGATFINIKTKDGAEYRGKFNVPSGHQFNRKLGLNRAIGRAMRTMK